MNVQASSEQLIHEILTVIVCQVLSWIYNSVHICFHEIGNNVDVFIASLWWWFLYVNKTNNVFMIEKLYWILKIEWWKIFKYLLSNLISLTILLASIRSSKALGTFLIATLALMEWSRAEHTTPYAPWPICLMYSYLS